MVDEPKGKLMTESKVALEQECLVVTFFFGLSENPEEGDRKVI